MKGPITKFLVSTLLTGLAACTQGSEVKVYPCGPARSSLARLEALAKEQGVSGITARSALKYLAQEKLPTSGYLITKNPIDEAGSKIEYHLYHESGFGKPCAVGNQSGLDGVLEVDPSTHEVRRYLLWQ